MSNLNPTTNQRQWEHKAHTTHDKDKHNKVQKTKEMSILNPCVCLCGVLCVPYVPIVSGLL